MKKTATHFSFSFSALALVMGLALIFATANPALARETGPIYVGGSFLRTMSAYKALPANSNFNGWGGGAVAGLDFSDENSGPFLEGEYGQIDLMNTYATDTYLEKSSHKYISARLGYKISYFGLSGGAQYNDILIENVASLGAGVRNRYEGVSYFGAARLAFKTRESVMSIVELKYNTGTIKTLELSETQLSLKIVFSPF